MRTGVAIKSSRCSAHPCVGRRRRLQIAAAISRRGLGSLPPGATNDLRTNEEHAERPEEAGARLPSVERYRCRGWLLSDGHWSLTHGREAPVTVLRSGHPCRTLCISSGREGGLVASPLAWHIATCNRPRQEESAEYSGGIMQSLCTRHSQCSVEELWLSSSLPFDAVTEVLQSADQTQVGSVSDTTCVVILGVKMHAGEGPTLEEIEKYNSVVNQTFTSEAEFYEFYNNYAKGKGFSVRKDSVRKRPGTNEVIRRRFLRQGSGSRPQPHLLRLQVCNTS
ncbi:hypothetical protein ACP70R_044402 [Stipagrostis hirtigluma subsp. patula]